MNKSRVWITIIFMIIKIFSSDPYRIDWHPYHIVSFAPPNPYHSLICASYFVPLSHRSSNQFLLLSQTPLILLSYLWVMTFFIDKGSFPAGHLSTPIFQSFLWWKKICFHLKAVPLLISIMVWTTFNLFLIFTMMKEKITV
jgi:hypothetical protein